MKTTNWVCAMLPLALSMAQGASASTVLYDNGPISGVTNAYTISAPSDVSNSFTLTGASTATGVNFGVWTTPGDTINSINWDISSGTFGSGTLYASGTATPTNSLFAANVFGAYDVNAASFSFSGVNLSAGTYYLSLHDAATNLSGQAFWDENDGSSTAAQTDGNNLYALGGSESFQIIGASAVPEPSQTAALVLGIASLGGLMLFARKRQNTIA